MEQPVRFSCFAFHNLVHTHLYVMKNTVNVVKMDELAQNPSMHYPCQVNLPKHKFARITFNTVRFTYNQSAKGPRSSTYYGKNQLHCDRVSD